TVRDIAKEFDLEAVRMFMLSAQYRSPINFSRDMIEQASTSLARLYTARNNALFLLDHASERALNEAEIAFCARADKALSDYDAAMDDDLNTADALGVIFDYARDMNSTISDANAPCKAALEKGISTLLTMTGVLGLLSKEEDATPEDVKKLVEARVNAKKAKDFALADSLRKEALVLGYVIEDTPKGPKVRKA
ncbi:MAG: DALR domain-containing protein, partial [Clostridia bacterium]